MQPGLTYMDKHVLNSIVPHTHFLHHLHIHHAGIEKF